jgi:peptidoglycan hydrolase-like protein with peptidoglycan-binding domain
MQTLRRGRKGSDVRRWQEFLLGLGLYDGTTDGDFGPRTEQATRRFQQLRGLGVDGVAGNETIGAAMTLGFQVVDESGDPEQNGPNWPPRSSLKALGDAGRKRLFGEFQFKALPDNSGNIKILGSWQRDNIVSLKIPQLRGVVGAPANGNVWFHRAAADQLRQLFEAWQNAGLIDLVRSWAGSFVPRFVRGRPGVLSNHAWGTAFDINAAWNGLGARPALLDKPGSVRKLVPLANEHGFFWGGHFGGRPDGMHFECARGG